MNKTNKMNKNKKELNKYNDNTIIWEKRKSEQKMKNGRMTREKRKILSWKCDNKEICCHILHTSH